MINSCAFCFLSSRFSSFTLCLLYQYLSLLPRPPTSLYVCLHVCLSVSLFLSISLSHFRYIFFLSVCSISVYNTLLLFYPEGLFLSVFFGLPSLSLFLSLSFLYVSSLSFIFLFRKPCVCIKISI